MVALVRQPHGCRDVSPDSQVGDVLVRACARAAVRHRQRVSGRVVFLALADRCRPDRVSCQLLRRVGAAVRMVDPRCAPVATRCAQSVRARDHQPAQHALCRADRRRGPPPGWVDSERVGYQRVTIRPDTSSRWLLDPTAWCAARRVPGMMPGFEEQPCRLLIQDGQTTTRTSATSSDGGRLSLRHCGTP